MNITITISGDTNSPDVQNLLQHLASTLPAKIKIEDTGSEVPSKPKRTAAVKPTPSGGIEEATEEVKTEVISEKSKWKAEEVRAAAIKLSKDGKREEVKALIETFGVPNLAGLTEENFNSFMEKLEKL